MRRLAVLLTLLALSAVAAGPASAEIVQRGDGAGRTITFDVQAAAVDVDWYASLLGGALHGDEIERVVVRIVEPGAIRRECGPGAAACYGGIRSGARIIVPAGRSNALAVTLLHEYGHHVDASRRVSGVAEPNGTARWWRARGMGQLLEQGAVARSYRLGWDRSIGEIFAEDYVQAHFAGAPYAIRWLLRPGAAVRTAIVNDLGGTAPTLELPEADEVVPVPPEAGAPRGPVSIERSGVLVSGETASVRFGLLGPGRRVQAAVQASGSSLAGSRLRVSLVCGTRVVATSSVSSGARSTAIDRRRLGPADCRVAVRNTSSSSLRVVVRLTLSIPR